MSVQACADLLRRGDPDRFLAVMAAPGPARARLFPLYAFNLEVARAPWAASEPMLAEMRLQWWRDALEEIAAGGTVRRHEVVTPLAEVLDGQVAELLDGLIEARRRDCQRSPFADRAAFGAYIDATAGNLMWAAARVLGADAGEAAIRDFGHAAGVAGFLVALPVLEARGYAPFAGGGPGDMAALAEAGLARLAAARRARAEIPPAAVPALRTGWRAGAVLRAARADPEAVAEGRLEGSEFARRGGLLWKTLTGRW